MTMSDKILQRAILDQIALHAKLKAAFESSTEIKECNITVTVDGGKVTLSGHVDTWGQDNLAVHIAWSTPEVTEVEDRLTVG
jgi:osmotically-inducible protein OsmY